LESIFAQKWDPSVPIAGTRAAVIWDHINAIMTQLGKK
jgi:hypothetical protein